jgi:RNA polymerase sigma factor (sigma-70 family)
MRVYAGQLQLRTDDAALVRRTQAGETRAFEAIFKRHHAPLLSYCRHMLCTQDEAEDALQQAFIKAHGALLGGTAPRELRPWLYAIARNCCLTAIAARRPTAPLEASLEDRTPSLRGLSEEVHQREDLRELLAGIGRLPEDQRSALLLAELDDLDHRAIAAIVGCEVSKVKALIYQARSALIADRDAQNTPCRDIREQLAVARGGELRRGPLRRHLKLCVGCRDFQLALGAQRQALGALLPVAPSAGLAASILGHGAAHAAGAASIGGASAGGAGLGATSTGGAGIATTGTAASTAAVGASAGAGGGTGIGALVGGGVITKLAVGGAILALASAGAVTVHNREAQALGHRPAHVQLVSSNTGGQQRISATDIAGSGSYRPGSGSSLVLSGWTPPPSPAGSTDPGSLTALSSLGNADPLLSASGTPAPSGATPGSPGQPATTPEQGKNGTGSNVATDPGARARHRAALRHRRELLRRKALLRRQRAARRRARRRALKRRQPVVKAAAPTPVTTPPQVHTRHRKAHPTTAPAPVTPAPAETTGAGSEGRERKGKRRRSRTSTGPASTETGLETETKPETGPETETGPRTGTMTGTGTTGAEETAKGRSSSEPGGGETDEKAPGGSTGSPGKPNPKEHSGEEAQPTNLRGAPEVTGVDVHQNPTEETSTGGTHNAS